MYENVTIIGNTGQSPELRYTQAGVACCNFSVAVNKRWKDYEGQQQEQVKWFRITCWRGLAETVNQYVEKGRQVMVVGTIDTSAWLGKDGEPRATLELTAQTVKFLGNRTDSEGPPPSDPDLKDIPF